MDALQYTAQGEAHVAPLAVSVVSAAVDRRLQIRARLGEDPRLLLLGADPRGDDQQARVVVLDVAGSEPYAAELIARLSSGPNAPRILAMIADEDDVAFACSTLHAGAAGVVSLRQPSSCLCQATIDVAAGLASVSPAVEAALVRRVQAVPAD